MVVENVVMAVAVAVAVATVGRRREQLRYPDVDAVVPENEAIPQRRREVCTVMLCGGVVA